jgi:tripartite-type tricarboxylate transporter receptor subunit TctC
MRMSASFVRLLLLGLASLLSGVQPALGQSYPARPVALVVPFSAGGPTDTVARILANAMSKTLGKSVVVENRTGAGGTIGAGYVARARKDGYTFLLHHNGMATSRALYRELPYDALSSFEYVGQVVDVPMTLVGRPDLPPDNMKALIAWLRSNREAVNLAHAGPGSASHMCAMQLRRSLGLELTTVPFQGTAPAMTALLGGHVDLLCDQTTQTLSYIRGKKVKMYGASTRQRISSLPDAPTLIEGGLKDFEVIVWHGIYAPKGTPKVALDTFGNALRQALKDPEVLRRFRELGGEPVSDQKVTPAGLRDWLNAEIAKWTPIIQSETGYLD